MKRYPVPKKEFILFILFLPPASLLGRMVVKYSTTTLILCLCHILCVILVRFSPYFRYSPLLSFLSVDEEWISLGFFEPKSIELKHARVTLAYYSRRTYMIIHTTAYEGGSKTMLREARENGASIYPYCPELRADHPELFEQGESDSQ